MALADPLRELFKMLRLVGWRFEASERLGVGSEVGKNWEWGGKWLGLRFFRAGQGFGLGTSGVKVRDGVNGCWVWHLL